MNVFPDPLASLSPIPQYTHSVKTLLGEDGLCFQRMMPSCVVIRVEVCVTVCVCHTYLGGKKVFLHLMDIALQSTAGDA